MSKRCEKHAVEFADDGWCWRCDEGVPATPTGDPQPGLEHAWAEIRDTMADTILNQDQKKAFVISILKGQLANPPPPPMEAKPAPASPTVSDLLDHCRKVSMAILSLYAKVCPGMAYTDDFQALTNIREVFAPASPGTVQAHAAGRPMTWTREKIRVAQTAGEITGKAESISWFLENDKDYPMADAVRHLNSIAALAKSLYEPSEAKPGDTAPIVEAKADPGQNPNQGENGK